MQTHAGIWIRIGRVEGNHDDHSVQMLLAQNIRFYIIRKFFTRQSRQNKSFAQIQNIAKEKSTIVSLYLPNWCRFFGQLIR